MEQMDRQSAGGARCWLPWVVWAALLALWTFGLLAPDPVPPGVSVPRGFAFPVAKCLHVSAYTLLAALLAWLPVGPGLRWALALGLVLHGGATEFVQTFIPTRTGTLRDVALDTLGVTLGVALSWAWWRRPLK
jgi:VanZ family protein